MELNPYDYDQFILSHIFVIFSISTTQKPTIYITESHGTTQILRVVAPIYFLFAQNVFTNTLYTYTSACRCDTFRSSSFYLFILFVRMEYRNENKTSNNLIKIVRYFTLSPNSCWCGCGQFHADTHIIFRHVIRFACTTRTSSVEKYAQEWDPIEFIRWTNAPESIFTFVFYFIFCFKQNIVHSTVYLYICDSSPLFLQSYFSLTIF